MNASRRGLVFTVLADFGLPTGLLYLLPLLVQPPGEWESRRLDPIELVAGTGDAGTADVVVGFDGRRLCLNGVELRSRDDLRDHLAAAPRASVALRIARTVQFADYWAIREVLAGHAVEECLDAPRHWSRNVTLRKLGVDWVERRPVRGPFPPRHSGV